MFTRGEFTTGDVTYGVMMSHSKVATEAILITSGTVVSAYKTDVTGSYSYNNNKAKELVQLIQNGVKGCTSKNATPAPFELGAMTQHEFIKTKVEYIMQLHKGEVVGAYIQSDSKRVELSYVKYLQIPTNIPYIKLMEISKNDLEIAENDLDSVPVRSVEEIALEKEDLTWLQNKKYYIVNDDETAEKIFQFLDNYNGVIAYDTETTGLRINCFGKINSEYQKTLIKYNEEHPDEQIRADRLVGIIFCVENDVSYYFPCFNRKFKNLYEDLSSPIRQKIISNVKARYTVGDLKDTDSEMRGYIINTPAEEISCDVILMERVRDILSTKHIVAHNGTFEWKVGWQYEIDTNLKDDTMIMHQLMYKFRSTTRNSGEPSNLKYLAKRELGVDQWELTDFFPDLKEDKTGTVRTKAGARGKKSGIKIDFSYMDYEGTRVYAPTDGDVTFQLFNLYKADMMKNHKEMEYIYSVEVIVSCAVAYMEFYGHKLDESKILGARESTRADIAEIVSEIRQSIDYSNQDELTAYAELKELRAKIESEQDKSVKKQLTESLPSFVDKLNKAIDENTDKVINLASPAQVADLFYNKLGYPMQGDKMSVAKKEIKGLLKEKNEDGTPKCPVAALYSKYKNADTLMTKFFDNLPYFMYPGGYIFSSFGQISTATGRMSCSKPNAQQYPKVITKIVSPRPGYVMMDADYSQIEYRVLTALAKNDWLAELFSNPDSDYHTLMASLMYGVDYAAVTPSMRSAAKSFNFGIPYGMGLGSLAILLTGKNTAQTRDEAAEKMEDYFKNQPRTRKFFDNVKEMAQVNGYTKTLFNRYRYYSFTDKDGNVNNGKKAAALRQAGNAVIQGTAADIFKIGVARNFSFIRKYHLFGKLLIINMIHDEQLMEVDVQHLNMQRILAEVGKNMQFKIEGFPPLYIGAGIGKAWGYAKGKMAEIHPTLLEELTKEAANIPIYRTPEEIAAKPVVDTDEVLAYFDNRVYEFRRKKVADYLSNSENWHKDLHPAIGGLINLQFNYGRGDDAKSYKGPNGETYSDSEFLLLNMTDFINENGIDAKPEYFKAQEIQQDVEEDKEYDESEDGDDIEGFVDDSTDVQVFSKVDESDKVFGSSVHDLIGIFGTCVLEQQKICGIDTRNLYYKKLDAIIDYLMNFVCDEDDDGALQVVFLTNANVLNYTGIYVKSVKASEFEAKYKAFLRNDKIDVNKDAYKEGDIDNRSQAK